MTDESERARAEALAPYTALIRHELGVAPGIDACALLRERLEPARPSERPPARAPGVVRLRAALRALEAKRVPELGLEQLIDDLRFLRLFEPTSPELERDAMTRLLRDVMADDA